MRLTGKFAILILVLAVVPGGAWQAPSQDARPAPPDAGKPAADAVPHRDLDARINKQLYFATLAGVQAFNQPRNDPATCAGIYLGAIIMAEGMLEHRPELKAKIERDRKQAETLLNPVERAKALRKIIDETREELEKGQRPALNVLWHRLGGERGVAEMVHEFLDAALKDPAVDLTRGGKFPLDGEKRVRLERSLVDFISSLSGGPFQYKGKDMKSAHEGMQITSEQFDALARHFVAVLRKRRVAPADIEFLSTAFALTKKDIVAAEPKPAEKPKPSTSPAASAPLKEFGGAEALRPVMRDFVAAALHDPKVDFTRGGKFDFDAEARQRLEQNLTDYFASVLEGTKTYRGRDMKTAHEGMQITSAQFDAMLGHLRDALKKHNVPEPLAAEMVKAFEATREHVVEKP
ncbi:MAG: group 1 truncated hemoglobin [Gemmatales bacterium]|nr:group 1 truncated hemoglobin [Gemmatales bacterium]MDW8385986.1 group 1 truncated hemoglobin [Gemmatales bacterium]